MTTDVPFQAAVREAIRASGLSLRSIRDILETNGHDISLASLSAWQNGHREPSSEKSLAALDALEMVVGAEPGQLRGTLKGVRLPGRRVRFDGIPERMPASEAVARAVSALGFADADDIPHELVVVQRLTLSSRKQTAAMDFHILVRALTSGQCRIPSVHVLDDNEPNVAPVFSHLRGCRIGRVIEAPEARTYGAELILDDDVMAGDLAFCDFRVTLTADTRSIQVVNYSLSRAAREVLVEVDFDEDLHPTDCTAYRDTDAGEEAAQVLVKASNRFQAAARDFGPGQIGLRWSWDDE